MEPKALPVSCGEPRWAWLAGLVDGDGCFTLHNGGSVHIEIAMTDKPTIDFLQATFGGKVYTPTTPRPNARQYWKWIVGPTWLRLYLQYIEPHMVTKRPRAVLVQEYLNIRKNAGGVALNVKRAEQIRQELKALNKRGLT